MVKGEEEEMRLSRHGVAAAEERDFI